MAAKKPKRPSPFAKALLETAGDLHRIGIMDYATYRKITVRHLGEKARSMSAPISPNEIRAIRERANLSQAALASMMNLTVGYLSQLERGVKQPKGPSLALLNVIRRKGIEVIL
jgi:putative transcriptional regulator